LILVGFLLALAIGLWVPYWFIFLLIGANDSNLFPWTIYLMITITFIAMVVGPIIHSSIGFLIKLNENFWDGLSQNAINSALEKSKKKK
jgi:Ni/Fe-hydrogenase subunit HybB-like protein